jgi:hypothetical protein
MLYTITYNREETEVEIEISEEENGQDFMNTAI